MRRALATSVTSQSLTATQALPRYSVELPRSTFLDFCVRVYVGLCRDCVRHNLVWQVTHLRQQLAAARAEVACLKKAIHGGPGGSRAQAGDALMQAALEELEAQAAGSEKEVQRLRVQMVLSKIIVQYRIWQQKVTSDRHFADTGL
jgi:hypothetical protein